MSTSTSILLLIVIALVAIGIGMSAKNILQDTPAIESAVQPY